MGCSARKDGGDDDDGGGGCGGGVDDDGGSGGCYMPNGGHYHVAGIKRNRNDAKMVPWLCTMTVEEKKLEVFSRASSKQLGTG